MGARFHTRRELIPDLCVFPLTVTRARGDKAASVKKTRLVVSVRPDGDVPALRQPDETPVFVRQGKVLERR